MGLGGGVRTDEREEFREFAEARASRMFKVAYLMSGNWHEAEDLAQETLAKLYAAWPRVRKADNPDAYAQRALVNTFLAGRRRKSSGELPVTDVEVYGGSAAGVDTDLRITLVRALRELPPKGRAVVVLRYVEDHSVESVAALLGMSQSGVKSAGMRGLAQLRRILDADREHLFHQ